METTSEQKTRCFATGRGFFVRLPITQDVDINEAELQEEDEE
ncbi:hypothetical protein [Alginatibacterium sediminis]|nr:hypothetical protein [Alginatibacterium sediminis]